MNLGALHLTIGIGVLALCSTVSLYAQPAEAPSGEKSSQCSDFSAASEEMRRCVQRTLNERLSVWRNHLSLEEWQISIAMVRRDDLKARTLGGIRWDKGKKTAVISVLDVSEYRLPFSEMLSDMEFTVVHELVHLELASLPRSEASRSKEEHAVNRLTEALLKLNRSR